MSSKTARSGPKVTRVTAGTYVFREGDLGTEMFVVRSGRIEIQKRGPSADQRLAVLEKGDPFGEMVVLDDVSYGVSAVATLDSELVRLNRAMFDRVLRGNPEIAVRIMRKLTARIRALEAQLAGEAVSAEGPAGAPQPSDSRCAFVTPEGTQVAFSIGVNTVVGREDPVTGLSPGVDLTPIDPERSSSRQHARLFAEEGRFFLTEDIGTTNGTFVNDVQLKPGVAVEIVPGDRLRFGLVRVDSSFASRAGIDLKVTLQTPLEHLRGVGPARARALEEVGFRNVAQLLLHLPYRYEDRRHVLTPADVREPGSYTLTGRLRDLRAIRVRRRKFSLVRGVLHSGASEMPSQMPVVWFNRPYLVRQVNEETEYLLHGAVRVQGGKLELVNPSCEPVDRARHSARIAPVYSSIGKLGPAFFRRVFGEIFEDPTLLDGVRDALPEELRRRYSLPIVGQALRQLHLPEEDADIDALNERGSSAHLRLIYGEFLELQLELALLRERQVREPKLHRYRVDDDLREVARAVLPFKLTGAQKRVLKEIVDDLQSDYPMLRLIQGDVGSGKTIVGALSLVVAVESGLQGAFMAPTELLAEQQYRSLVRILGARYRIGLFTSSVAEIESEREALASGRIQIAVGTHALIQDSTRFHALGLGIIDEQHRFGVAQRQLLQSKGDRPDMLVMTATPIPRSLALTVYGDLALSVIDELPPGRQPIETRVVATEKRDEVYAWLDRQLAAGGRAYIVCPLIEDSDQVAAPSVEALEGDLRRRLSGRRFAVLHGRIGSDDRDKIMRCFAAGELDVLLATTIVEVGVDVPEATVMVIEGAERFGLAQLHQLRGRVGRGAKRSVCVALHGALSAEGEKRLGVFGASTDGFRIAEADLDIRGPGDLLGTRQAGLPVFRAADLLSDTPWLERARADAREILSADTIPPEYDALLARVEPRVTNRYERFAGG